VTTEFILKNATAVLVNYTGYGGHWGSYGTSCVLYRALVDRGFITNLITVDEVRRPAHTLRHVDDLADDRVFASWCESNPSLWEKLEASDLIVINGEGTIHRNHAGPMNLLYLAHIAHLRLRRRVALVNHSCFPNGNESPASPELEAIYKAVYQGLDFVATREPLSTMVLRRLGVRQIEEAFDCLPLFIRDYYRPRGRKPSRTILVSGGAVMTTEAANAMAEAIAPYAKRGWKVHMLTGRKDGPSSGDLEFLPGMASVLGEIVPIVARSADEWLFEIERADLLVSGRFHHSISAAVLGTPFVALSSNTSKIEGVCQMLGLPAPQQPARANLAESLTREIELALETKEYSARASTLAKIMTHAERNFAGFTLPSSSTRGSS